jgi:hypothetical protein
MTRTALRIIFPFLSVPVLLTAGCSGRPQPSASEVSGAISPPALRYGQMPPGGVTMSATGGAAGGSGAGGIQYQIGRTGGPVSQPTVGAPPGSQIVPDNQHRMSPTTYNAAANYSSDGSGLGDPGTPIPPNVPLVPENAPGADTHPTGTSQ